ncbi:MAG: hypothetical protein ABWY93_25980 [Mycobacterium sp.]
MDTVLDTIASQTGISRDDVAGGLMAQGRATSLLQRFATPQEVANLITYLASPGSAATNGSAVRVEGQDIHLHLRHGVLMQRTVGTWSEDSFAEDDPFDPEPLASGLRAKVVRPPYLQGDGEHGHLSAIYESVARTGSACYIGDGIELLHEPARRRHELGWCPIHPDVLNAIGAPYLRALAAAD